MDNPKILFGFAAIGIIFLLILFAIWQHIAKKKLPLEKLDINSYPVFKNITPYQWYISVETFALSKMFSQSFDRCGKTTIYDKAHVPVGEIGLFNKYKSTIKSGARSISTNFELADFTNFLRYIEFFDDRTGGKILTIEPLKNAGFWNVDYEFTIDEKNYRLKSLGLSEYRDYACDIYMNGSAIGRIARVSIRQFPMAVLKREIDPIVIALIFDLFQRYSS